MTRSAKKPVRWAEDASRLEPRLSDLFRAVETPAALDDRALAQVHRRLSTRSPRRRSSFVREALVVVATLLGSGGAAFAGLRAAEWVRERVVESPPRVESSAKSVEKQRATLAAKPPAQTAMPELVQEEHVPSDSSGPAKAFSSFREPSKLAHETEALERALVELRARKNPTLALSLLEDYERRYPNGVLRTEAELARVDALLLLERRAEALAELARLPLDRVTRGGELRLVRAELLAERDCAAALRDFQALAAMALPPAFAERALYGHSVCSLKLGDRSGATRGFTHYLARFPGGRFSEQARAALR